jgi:hypothetical protein
MKLSDYITILPIKDASDKRTGYSAVFAGEETLPVIPMVPVQPTKQMAVQALINNAISARVKKLTNLL